MRMRTEDYSEEYILIRYIHGVPDQVVGRGKDPVALAKQSEEFMNNLQWECRLFRAILEIWEADKILVTGGDPGIWDGIGEGVRYHGTA